LGSNAAAAAPLPASAGDPEPTGSFSSARWFLGREGGADAASVGGITTRISEEFNAVVVVVATASAAAAVTTSTSGVTTMGLGSALIPLASTSVQVSEGIEEGVGAKATLLLLLLEEGEEPEPEEAATVLVALGDT